MARLFRRKYRRIIIDVDTQYDFFSGCDRDHAELLRKIRRLMAWARVHRIPVISTALARRPNNGIDQPYGHPGCVEGTLGQRKIPYTTLPSNILFGPENRLDLPRNLLSQYRQITFEKRTPDPFDQPRADRLLSDLKADRFIVFGMGLEYAVKATVLGLLYRRKNVTVVSDAVHGDNERSGNQTLRQMEAKGAKLMTTRAITGKSRLTGNVTPSHAWLLSVRQAQAT